MQYIIISGLHLLQMLSLQHHCNQNQNFNQLRSKNLILSTDHLSIKERILLYTGYFSALADLIPDRTTIALLQQTIQNYIEQNQLTIEKIIQIFIQASMCMKYLNNGLTNDQLLSLFCHVIQDLKQEILINDKHIIEKWMSQDKKKIEDKQRNFIIEKEKEKEKQKEREREIEIEREQKRKRERERDRDRDREREREMEINIQKEKEKKKRQQQLSLKFIKQLQEQDQYQQKRNKFQYFLRKIRQDDSKKKSNSKKQLVCQICQQQIQENEKGQLKCGHNFHDKCIYQHIKAYVDEKKVQIPCPSGCESLMQTNEVLEFIDGQVRQKYEKYTFDNYVEKQDKYAAWCPTADCTAVFTHDGTLTKYKCPVCKKKYCLKCKCDYHSGMTCGQYRIKKSSSQADKKFQQFVAGAKFKQCPNCRTWVQRISGCVSMKCRCGIQFCYNCGGIGCPHGNCKKNL